MNTWFDSYQVKTPALAFDAGCSHRGASSLGRTDKYFLYFVRSGADLGKLARANAHGVKSSYPSKLMDYCMTGSATCPMPWYAVDTLRVSIGQRVWSHYGHDEEELWWPARVIGVSESFAQVDVVYDDGDFEEAKPLQRIRPWCTEPSSAPSSGKHHRQAGASAQAAAEAQASAEDEVCFCQNARNHLHHFRSLARASAGGERTKAPAALQ